MEYEGFYSDGESAASHPARVRFEDTGLRISGEDWEIFWPYKDLISSGPVLARHEAQVGCRDFDGARLHVKPLGFTTELLARAPHLGQKAHDGRILKPMLIAAAMIVAGGLIFYFSNISLAAAIARMIPQDVRASIGDRLSRSMSKGRYCAAPAGKAALRKLVLRLKRPGTDDVFVVRVARLGMLNAFTVPGQRIIISKKLLDFADTPDELAGVLAHEMGHALELHPEASIVRSLGISALGALLFGQSSNMESLAAIMLQLAYSRQAERQADDWALKLLRQAKISPRGFAAFFTKLKKKYGDTSGFLGAFSTHPATAERIEHIRNAGTWPATPALDAADWKALKSICGKS